MIKIEQMREFLKLICSVFNEYGVDYWIDFGTLLGITRDGDIIEWDTDIDLSIKKSEGEKVRKIIYKLFSFPHLQYVKCHVNSTFKIMMAGDKWFCDVYPWEPFGRLYRHPHKSFGIPTFPAYEIEEFSYISWNGVDLRVPLLYNKRLERIYGDYSRRIKYDEKVGHYWTGKRVSEYKQRNKEMFEKL